MSAPRPTKTELASPFSTSTDLDTLSRSGIDVSCRPVASEAERHICAELRHSVFVEEQSIFDGTDRDVRDTDPATIHLVADVGGVAGGTVRLYPLDSDGLWKGDRLAVARSLRNMVVGKRLVQAAVRTAGELGGHEMVASVQVANTGFFVRLGWVPDGEPRIEYGLPHQRMRIQLVQT